MKMAKFEIQETTDDEKEGEKTVQSRNFKMKNLQGVKIWTPAW